jgi:hypothetical protein
MYRVAARTPFICAILVRCAKIPNQTVNHLFQPAETLEFERV